MSKTFSRKPMIIALGAAFAIAGGAAQASVFQTSDLGAGYMVASAADTKMDAKEDAKEAAAAKKHGSNCDAKLGADQKTGECMCGAAKGKMADGKCGEGKCGEGKKK